MKRTFLLAMFVLCALAVTQKAQAYWQTQLVPETYTVTVHPTPYFTCSGWVTPAPYQKLKTRWVRQRYWVEPAPVVVAPSPIVVKPEPPCPLLRKLLCPFEW